jgi:hypothetical protein
VAAHSSIDVLFDLVADDWCRLDLLRGDGTDVLRMTHDTYGEFDARVELSATPGSDTEAARQALVAVARRGRLSPGSARAGLLDAAEIEAAIQQGWSGWLAELQAARRASEAEEARNPSRILAAARAVGLRPEPVGTGVGNWVAGCPGRSHTLMLRPRSEQFGCGYCKVKGGPELLAEFVARRRGWGHGGLGRDAGRVDVPPGVLRATLQTVDLATGEGLAGSAVSQDVGGRQRAARSSGVYPVRCWGLSALQPRRVLRGRPGLCRFRSTRPIDRRLTRPAVRLAWPT